MMLDEEAWPEDTRCEWNVSVGENDDDDTVHSYDDDCDVDERPIGGGFSRNRYKDAFGDHTGGYGSGGFQPHMGCGYGPFGPPGREGPRGGFGGPPFRGRGGFGVPRGPPPDLWGCPRGPPGFDGPPPRPFFRGPMRGGPMGVGPIRGGPFRGGPPSVGPIRGGPMGGKTSKEARAVNYLMRCGMSKESVKNLPRAVIDLIEPQYCGLCSVDLDSYAFSRVHYASKTHLRNQMKWMQQIPEEVSSGPHEAPMKARELYCELCDVHITSKMLADSHYLGKSHRSVVEGRRPPKNPFLCKPNMEKRVQQLIRREEKYLPELPPEPAPAPRVVPPELRCDICKTSVTNTEQMTMHMNGKRHLNKEKQHILRVMKGELPADSYRQQHCFQDPEPQNEDPDDDETDKLDAATEQFVTNTIEGIFNKTQPVASSKRKRPLKPWITPGMVTCMRQRDQIHVKAKKNPDSKELVDQYKRYRNFVNGMFRRLKVEYEKVRLEREGPLPQPEAAPVQETAQTAAQAPSATGLAPDRTTDSNGDDWQIGSVDW